MNRLKSPAMAEYICRPDLKTTFLTFCDLDSQALMSSRKSSAARLNSAGMCSATNSLNTQNNPNDAFSLAEIPEDNSPIHTAKTERRPLVISRSGKELENFKSFYFKRDAK